MLDPSTSPPSDPASSLPTTTGPDAPPTVAWTSPTAQLIDPRFSAVARAFEALYRKPRDGGGALAVYLHGEPVLDVWSGFADVHTGRPWRSDTMAMSFSTTKGVTSTLVHRLVAKGVLDVDEPVATYWPAFGARDKHDLLVADVMTHRSGLHRVRGIAEASGDLLDHRRMAAVLAGRRPEDTRGVPAYHAMTYGYLIAAIVEGATGRPFEAVLADEVRRPLGLDGLFISAPVDQHQRIAPFFETIAPFGMSLSAVGHWVKKVDRFRPFVDALLPHGFDEMMNSPAMWQATIPAANGMFTARSLARMYGALANGGIMDGEEFLPHDVLQEAGRVRTKDRDRVLGFRMRWRLGYHQAFTSDRSNQPRMAFGHYGLGGSGAFADPETGLSMAFVTNKLGRGSTPVADFRLPRLAAVALAAARTP